MKIEWIQSKPIDNETIEHTERYFGIKFPNDYKDCIKEVNGGYPTPDTFNFDGRNEAVLLCLLSLTSQQGNITEVYDLNSNVLPAGVYPFARDPFGNLICFDYRGDIESPIIVFFDHELDSNEAIYYVCNTFTELLESLYSIDE